MPSITQTAAAPAPTHPKTRSIARSCGASCRCCCSATSWPLDRVNVGFAKLQMLDELSLSDGVYALGASIFFWGYFLFEMPSNLLLHRYGARFWIARIMITWGIVSSSMAFIVPLAQFFHVQTTTMFYAALPAGPVRSRPFPGVILYMNYWFPARRQSVAMSGFLVAIPLSLTLGSVVSGWLMEQTHGLSGMSGWQWMLLLEGLPSIVVAFIVLACWATARSRRSGCPRTKRPSCRAISNPRRRTSRTASGRAAQPRVWLLTFILLTFNTGFYGLAFWLPSIIRASGVRSPLHIGVLTAIPYLTAIFAMVWNASHSRKTGERRLHAAIPALIGGVFLILSAAFAHNVALSIVFLTVATCGILALMPIYWTFPGQILSGTAAAAGIALINSVGNLSGFTADDHRHGQEMTGNINNGTYALGACLLVSCVLIALIPRDVLQPPAGR